MAETMNKKLNKKLLCETVIMTFPLALALLTALLFKASTLTTWDAVQFALALENYNVTIHQPHPPGYVSWVALLKTFSPMLDPNLASIIVNAVFEGFTAYLIHCLLHRILGVRRVFSLISALLWLVSPLSWYYRAVAENYASGTFFTMAIMYLTFSSMKSRDFGKALAASFLLGFSGGFRIEIPFFLLPVIAYTIISRFMRNRFSLKRLFLAVALYVLGIMLWLIPQALLCGGFMDWLNLTLNQFTCSFSKSAIGTVSVFHTIKRFVRSLTILVCGNGFNILSIPIAIAYIAMDKKMFKYINEYVLWMMITVLIFLAFTTLVHLGKSGYLLPATAILSVVLTYFVTKILRNTRIILTIMMLALLVNCLVFIGGSSEQEIIESSLLQRGILYSIGIPHTFNEIKNRDLAVQKLVEISQSFNPDNTVIIVLDPCYAVNWRRAMYYIPNHIVVQMEEIDELIHVKAFQQHRLLDISSIENKTLHSCLIVTSIELPYRILTNLGYNTYVYEIESTDTDSCISLAKEALLHSTQNSHTK